MKVRTNREAKLLLKRRSLLVLLLVIIQNRFVQEVCQSDFWWLVIIQKKKKIIILSFIELLPQQDQNLQILQNPNIRLSLPSTKLRVHQGHGEGIVKD